MTPMELSPTLGLAEHCIEDIGPTSVLGLDDPGLKLILAAFKW